MQARDRGSGTDLGGTFPVCAWVTSSSSETELDDTESLASPPFHNVEMKHQSTPFPIQVLGNRRAYQVANPLHRSLSTLQDWFVRRAYGWTNVPAS